MSQFGLKGSSAPSDFQATAALCLGPCCHSPPHPTGPSGAIYITCSQLDEQQAKAICTAAALCVVSGRGTPFPPGSHPACLLQATYMSFLQHSTYTVTHSYLDQCLTAGHLTACSLKLPFYLQGSPRLPCATSHLTPGISEENRCLQAKK